MCHVSKSSLFSFNLCSKIFAIIVTQWDRKWKFCNKKTLALEEVKKPYNYVGYLKKEKLKITPQSTEKTAKFELFCWTALQKQPNSKLL